MARYLGIDVVNEGKYYFISYNSEDADRVSEYMAALHSKGLPMWYDYGIEIGDKWSNTIAGKMSGSEAVIMFLSRQIFQKSESFVHKEWEMARDFFDKKIYVIILDDIDKKEVPLQYISWWIDINHTQCISAPRYTVNECADKIIAALGYKPAVAAKPAVPAKPATPRVLNLLLETAAPAGTNIEAPVRTAAEPPRVRVERKPVVIPKINIPDSNPRDFVIKNGELTKYKGNATAVKIPDGVIKIAFSAFDNCRSIETLVFPDSVVNIGDWAFSNCRSLKNIALPSRLKAIGEYAFNNCKSLEHIVIPDTVSMIGNSVFQECGALVDIAIPYGVSSIGNNMFYCCKMLKSIDIPESVTSIGKDSFYECISLESVRIPRGVTSIGKNAFASCGSLVRIDFGGTKEEWERLDYKESWYAQTPIYTINFER